MRAVLTLAALIALTVACSGGTPTSPSPPPSLPTGPTTFTLLTRGIVRATVDGDRWESTTAGAGFSSFTGTAPLLSLSASFGGVGPSQFQSLTMGGPLTLGTYTVGGLAFLYFSLSRDSLSRWMTSPFAQGGSGMLTITTATATRVAGTFSFTAVASMPGLTPATRTVTDGTFDLSQ